MFTEFKMPIQLGLLTALLLSGCQSVTSHRADVQDNSIDRMTVGKVQREIRVGMSSADVAQILGSPNIVSTDEERREVWIYDKIATDMLNHPVAVALTSLSSVPVLQQEHHLQVSAPSQ